MNKENGLKPRYQKSLALSEEDNRRTLNVLKYKYKSIDIFRAGLEIIESMIKADKTFIKNQ